MREPIFNWSYRKVGGLHFFKLGRLGCSFYVSRALTARPVTQPEQERMLLEDGTQFRAPAFNTREECEAYIDRMDHAR